MEKMEKYKPLRMGEYKSSYCLSSKNNKNTEDTSEFNVVLTKNIFKSRNLIRELKESKIKLESNLTRKKEEYQSVLTNINALIDVGLETQDEVKLDKITRFVKEHKDKKLFIQREADEIYRKIANIDLEIVNATKEKDGIIAKYNLDDGSKFKHIVCNKEDEEELKDTLERFGCLLD